MDMGERISASDLIVSHRVDHVLPRLSTFDCTLIFARVLDYLKPFGHSVFTSKIASNVQEFGSTIFLMEDVSWTAHVNLR